MPLQLTSKEKQLLNDQKNHEQVCIQKYQNYASQATDSQLKQLFQTHAQHEQQHLNTINSILSGQVPSMNQSQGQQSQSGAQSSSQTGSMQSSSQSGMQNSSQSGMQSGFQSGSMQSSSQTSSSAKSGANQADAMLCNDMLMTEKYVSGAYDTAIFEFTDSNVRQALNHIQKEEQKHGEDLFNYMSSNGMYNVQQ